MPVWMTPKQAADYLQVSEATVYRWTREGRLPAYRIGGSRRYKREDLDDLAEPIAPEEEGDDASEE
jgi:excisionase family DNA binding protein